MVFETQETKRCKMVWLKSHVISRQSSPCSMVSLFVILNICSFSLLWEIVLKSCFLLKDLLECS